VLVRSAVVPNALLAIFLAASIVHLGSTVFSPHTGSEVTTGVFWVSAALVVLASLTRRLPAQNAIAIGVLAGAIGAGLIFLPATRRFLFGLPAGHVDASGISYVDSLFPFFWIACVLGCRAFGRLVMLPFKTRMEAGVWILILASLLTAILATASIAAIIRPDATVSEGTLRFAGWILAAAATLALTFPWLINKRSDRDPMHPDSVIVWILLNTNALIQFCI
jgi:flagellar biosynthesis protein FliQ